MTTADPQPTSVGWIRMLAPILRPYRSMLIAAGALAALSQLMLALVPLVQKVVLDDTILANDRSRPFWLSVLIALGLLSFLGNYTRRRLSGRAAVNVQRDLQVAVHRHLQHLDSRNRDALRTGDIMSRATADITLIQMFLQQLAMTFGSLTLLASSVVAMIVLSPLLAVVIMVCIPVFWWVSWRFRQESFPASWMDQRYQGTVAGVVEEAITGVRIVKAFGQEQFELDSLTDEARQLYQSRIRTARINSRYTAVLQSVPTFGQFGVVALGGWLAMRGDITLGVFVAFTSYVAQLTSPVRMLSNVMATSQQARAGAQRVLELLAIQSTVTDAAGARPLIEPTGLMELHNVTFGYRPDLPVLHDVSLTVRPGERLAIVGGSGSGKSTIAHLFARFYDPDSGTVRIDGVDARDLTLESLHRSVGLVFEQSFLFSNTIRFNIAYGDPSATDDDVERAARIAQAHEFILGLPAGYDTVVGERGFTLSGGQRQRIALARAALSNPRVLILDDATSAIDARTEAAIHHSFDSVMSDRTTVLIAHRHSTLRLADRILVLDGGRIVAEGTTDELMASSALLRDLLTGPEVEMDEGPDIRIDDLDPFAWPLDVPREGAAKVSTRANGGIMQAASAGSKSLAGRTALLAKLSSESPELLAATDGLPPLAGDPGVDIPQVTAVDDAFSFRKVLRPFRVSLAFGAALVGVDAATTLVGPMLIRRAIDRGVLPGSSSTLVAVALVFLAVQVISLLNAAAMTYQTTRTAERMLFSLRLRTFAHLQRLSLDYYDQHMSGKIMSRMTSDVDTFAQLVQQGLLTALVSVLSCSGAIVLLVVLSPTMAAAVGLVFIPLVVGTLWFRRSSGRAYMAAREQLSILYSEMQESLAGVRVTQAHAQQAASEARFVLLANSYNQARTRSIELIARFFPFIQLASVVAKAVALGVGAGMIASGEVTAGVLVAFLVYLDLFFAPVQQLSTVFDQWLQAKVAVSQLTDLLQTPTTTPDADDPVAVEGIVGHIRFEHVELAYASTGLIAMHDVSLDIPAGQVVALVGTTGAGKSTLVKLVARFYDPTQGVVLIDGVPLKELDLAGYRHRLGYVPQEPFLFSGTVRTNICYGRPDASDLEVERAARAVGAHQLIAALPQGYHTAVSEEGRSLSAGQRQLISLARAKLVDPSIMLLDEATANLDLATEARVQRAMGLVARGRTTIVIAHRMQTARLAERILVIDEGRVVEDGSHEELLDIEGRYAELWSAFLASVHMGGPPVSRIGVGLSDGLIYRVQ